MPALMPKDTADALGPNAEKCDSRSLLLERFADPTAKGDDRKAVFTRASQRKAVTTQTAAWTAFLRDSLDLEADALRFAQLQSRLMVNLAGGVMENAGLCLDRFGLPYLPGSAVKGCARRAALAALHKWCETGQKPGANETEKDNLFKDACERFSKPADMLAAIARVFGWCEQDWKTREEILKGVRPKNDEGDPQFKQRCQNLWKEKRSDFAWACSVTADPPAPTGRDTSAQGNALGPGPQGRPGPEAALQPWPVIRDAVVRRLATDLRGQINPYATEPQFWTQKDERGQLTLLHFLLVAAPEQFATDRANSKSKIAKAIAHLTAKFPHVASAKP